MKEHTVKRIYFTTTEDGVMDIFPTFELENGEVKSHRPFFGQPMWMTDEEFEIASNYKKKYIDKKWWQW